MVYKAIGTGIATDIDPSESEELEKPRYTEVK